MENSLVSIVVPMKNAAAFVSDTIDSVLKQSYQNWEMIVVDDCSTDKGKSQSIIKRYGEKDPRIHLVCLTKSRGSSGARNEGLKCVNGRYLAFLDSDDIWHPEYLETMIKHIQNCEIENAAIFYCGYRRMNEDCSKVILSDYSSVGVKTYRKLLHNCPIFPSITIVDTQKLKSPVTFREELKSLRDDYTYLLDILSQGLVAVGFEEIMVDYRMRTNSMTASKKKMIKPQWKVYRQAMHLNLISSCFYMICWGLNGIKKYFFSKK